jgi:hypothetical protein
MRDGIGALFFFDPANRFVQFRGTFHSFDPVGFAIFANRPPNT